MTIFFKSQVKKSIAFMVGVGAPTSIAIYSSTTSRFSSTTTSASSASSSSSNDVSTSNIEISAAKPYNGLGSSCPKYDNKPLRLIQVHTAFRHGARTPMNDLGKQPVHWTLEEQDKTSFSLAQFTLYQPGNGSPIPRTSIQKNLYAKDEKTLLGGGYPGALTKNGMQMAIDLGTELRKRYVDVEAKENKDVRDGYLLPCTWSYARKLVNVQSTKTERTIETAQGLISGLFPNYLKGEENKFDIMFSGPSEYMVLNPKSCKKLQLHFAEGKLLSTQNRTDDDKKAIEIVENHSDGWVRDDEQWKLVSYRDQLLCRAAEHKAIPKHIVEISDMLDDGAQRQMEHIFEGGADFVENSEARRTEALKLGIGRMLTQIVDRMDRPDKMYHLYSGHDWTVSPLFMCVAGKGATHAWPPFCSNITFEVWSAKEEDEVIEHWANQGIDKNGKNDDGRYVRVLYNSEILKMPCSDNSGTNNQLCKMKDFKQMMSKFIVNENYTDICGGKGEWHSPSHVAKGEGKGSAVQGGAI